MILMISLIRLAQKKNAKALKGNIVASEGIAQLSIIPSDYLDILESVIEAHLDRSSVKMGFATLEEQLT
jgi:hypothetical protein